MHNLYKPVHLCKSSITLHEKNVYIFQIVLEASSKSLQKQKHMFQQRMF